MQTIIFHFTEEDRPFLPALKGLLVGRVQTYLDNQVPTSAYELVMKSKSKSGATVVTTSQKLLELLLPDATRPKISEYAGSFFKFAGTQFLIVNPLAQLITVPEGKFIFQRFMDKVIHPEKWFTEPVFKWELFSPGRMEVLFNFLETCSLIAVDIETIRNDPERRISCISFTGAKITAGKISMMTVVVPLTEMYNVLFVRLVCSNPVPKCLQNGKYDIAYLLRYGCPVTNYAFDTINLFHSWLCELPKDLGFISAFMLRNYVFHKNDGKSGDLLDYYGYNAKDTYTTLLATLALLFEIPDYAVTNFLQEFPVVFPCVLAEATGMKWDSGRAEKLLGRVQEEMEVTLGKLQTMVATPTYNPNSSQQTVRLFAVLGSKDVTSTTPPDKDKVSNRHPLNKKIIDGIVEYRENSKLRGSYFKESIPWLGRCFYALNPHGTDTGRLASRESQFWCGLQIQNIPTGNDDEDVPVKECFVADSGFHFGEADFSQAESKGTAHLSGDTALLAATTDPSKDFHGVNASAFFGVPYDRIVESKFDEELQEWVHKTLDKLLRNTIGKRINHGANYNMGPQVMLNTMGIINVIRAKQFLGLPVKWSPLQVCAHLLGLFEKTYPVMKGAWYDKCVNDVVQTGYLVGPTDWTRRCFGAPKKNKHHLNAYVAHPPQSLNAMILNKAWRQVFRNVWMKNTQDFKLCAQIHDSILFQYRIGREDLVWEVKKNMILPTPVKDTFGVTRVMTVPVDIKGGAARWSDVETLREPRERKVA